MQISDLVIENNHHWIALNKPSGMPVQPDLTRDPDLSTLAMAYCKRKLHLLNRIDRPASGLVLFSKSDKFRKSFVLQQQEKEVQKIYYVITSKGEIPASGVWKQYIYKSKRDNKAIVISDKKVHAKPAILEYQIVASNNHYHLWKINLLTGRFHQIRAQLADAGFPIRGDVKYGFKRAMRKHRIFLHAHSTVFKHPVKQTSYQIIAPLPEEPIWTTFNHNF